MDAACLNVDWKLLREAGDAWALAAEARTAVMCDVAEGGRHGPVEEADLLEAEDAARCHCKEVSMGLQRSRLQPSPLPALRAEPTIVVQVAMETSPAAESRVHDLIVNRVSLDPCWRGARFIVQHGPTTCIPDTDHLVTDALLEAVHAAIGRGGR